MARPGSVPRVIAATIVAAASTVAAGIPSAARAGDAGTETVILPGRTLSALSLDLDGDGAREIARLSNDIGPGMTVEVWAMSASGEWVPRWSEAVPDPTEGDPSIAHYVVAAAILEVRGPDGAGLLLVANGTDLNSQLGPHSCCLEIHEVVVGDHPLRLVPVDAPPISADEIAVADLDGDRIDDLVVSSSTMEPADAAPTVVLAGLRRSGDRFVDLGEVGVEAWSASAGVATIGDTDGLPGDELLFFTDDGAELVRASAASGTLTAERQPAASMRLQEYPWVAGVAGGRILITANGGPMWVSWPAGGEPVRHDLAGHGPSDFPVGIVGTGDEAVVILTSGSGIGSSRQVVELYDASFRSLGTVEVGSSAVDELWAVLNAASMSGGWTLQRTLDPFFGAIPPSRGYDAAWVMSGTVIEVGGPDGYRAREMTPLLGMPVGSAGPDDAWYAVCDGCAHDGRRASLLADPQYATGQLTVSRWDPFAEGAAPEVTVRHDGALLLGEDPEAGMTELVAGPRGFELVVEPSPGTAVVSWDGLRLVDHGFLTDAVRLRVDPPNLDREDLEEEDVDDASQFERTLIVIGPDGRFSVRSWTGTFAPDAPELSARPYLSSGLTAVIRGRTSPYATLTVDGRAVELPASGSFAETVGAPPWPRTVVIESTDPFGGVSQATVEVIGIADYRGLPWAFIIASVVATFGLVLFVRVPRLKRSATVSAADGELEEIDDLAMATMDRGRR